MMNTRRFALAVAPVIAAAAVGGLGARHARKVYAQINKPRWAPPPTVFGPVWTLLYAMTAASGWRLSDAAPSTKQLHYLQLSLNAAWPVSFFEFRNKPASLAIVVLLDITLALEIAKVRQQDRRAAALLAPYLTWSLFATALNLAVTEPRA